ncbi:hypothetical protein LAZ67_2003029, partial [Cordylochernes scorpioides]
MLSGDDANQTAEKSKNWADRVEASEIEFTSVGNKEPKGFKRKSNSQEKPVKISKADTTAVRPPQPPRRATRDPVTQVKNSRHQQALSKAISAAAYFDQCCYVEYCSDFGPVQYIKALEEMPGRGTVFQLMKMSGQVLVGLESTEKAERLYEEGLTIGNTLLKVFPYRKRAEKIVIGNLPVAIRDEDVIAALRPYCRVVSLTHEVVASGGYTWTTSNREAFILLNGKLKLYQLPAKLVIVSKGESTPAYITYGVRCSKCRRQGNRRATCPLGINGGRHQDTRQGLVSKPPSSKTSNNSAPTAAESSAPIKQTSSTPSSPPGLPRPEPSLAIIEPTAAPKKKTHNKTAPSIHSSTSMTQPLQPLREFQEILIERVEGIFEQMNADLFLSPLYEEFNWDEAMEHQDPNNEPAPFTKVERKGRRTSASQRVPTAQSGTTAPAQKSTNATRSGFSAGRRPLAQEIKATRKNIAEARAQQASGTVDQCVYVECCPEFSRVQYVLAMDKLVGGKNIIQLTKMNGHVLVGLNTKALAERLIEEGLEIEETLLKTYPFRKRAERLFVTNLPFFVEDAEIIAALKPYGQVKSIAPLIVIVAGFTMKDGRRELFILLNEGVKLERLPTRLNINHKGEILPAFLVYGVKCSRCQRQGHRRANGPLTPKMPTDASEQAPSNTGPSSPSLRPLHPPRGPILATSLENAEDPFPVSPSLSSPYGNENQRDSINLTHLGKSTKTKIEMKELLKQVPVSIFAEIEKLGLEREPVIEALQSVPGLKNLLPSMSDTQNTALNKLVRNLKADWEPTMNLRVMTLNARGLIARDRSLELCHFLAQHHVDITFIQETNKESLDYAQDLCLGYSAIVAPPAASRGSGLASLFVPGVALLQHRVLGPVCIDLVHLDVHGQKMAVINCHLSHAPHERLEQVRIISERAVRDNAWVVGDLGIDGGPAGATYSASVKSLSNLLEQAALEDAATFFNLSHLPTRVADFEVGAEDLDDGELWSGWNRIKAEISAEIRSFHIIRPEPEEDYVTRASRYIRARLEASSTEADYPSLPDLGRALRIRRGVATIVRNEEGEIMGDHELRSRALSFFRHRFAQDPADPAEVDNFIAGTTTPIILEEDDPLHRSDISREDIAAAIRRLPTGKASGWDSLLCELFSAYEDFFSALLGRVFGASLVRGALPSSTCRGSICLVPKARSGPGLTGFRPITLLSTDYRILAAILLRQIATAGRLPLAVVSVDLESAFDSLDREFLKSLLVSLGLPPSFIRWIQLLYARANAAVRIGDHHTAVFPILNGVRQGCAVSVALFSLATTSLLRRLQSALGEGNVIAYVDDIVLIVRQEDHFGEVASIFHGFQRASGIRVNFGKNVGLWCGAWRARVDSPLDISRTFTSLRILGCDIRPRASAAMQEGHLLDLVYAAFQRWAPFTCGLFLVAHSSISKLQARLVQFVRGSVRTAWLPADLLSRPVSLDGFGLLDLGTQMRLACIKGEEICRGSYRVNGIGEAIVLRETATPFQRLTTRTAHRMLERPRLAALPITQLLGRWLPHVSIPISIRHNADFAVRLALHALPHPAHPASARESCNACGSGDLSLAHRYWSCKRIRPVWIFGHGLEDDALAILASAKARIYRHFLTLELRGMQEDPLLVWRRTLSI